MKILFLIQTEIGPRHLSQIKALLKNGYAVQVVKCWNTSGDDYLFNPHVPVIIINNKRRVNFHQNLKNDLFAALKEIVFCLYPLTLRKVMDSSWDVLHCCHLSLLPLAVLGKILKGGCLVYDSKEYYALNISGMLKNRLLAKWVAFTLQKVENLCLRWVDMVFTVPSMGNIEWHKFSQQCNNVKVLMNVPQLNDFQTKEKTFPSPPSAIYIGGLMLEKGLYVMIDAVSKITSIYPDFKLILIGHLKENRNQIIQAIKRLNLSERIIIYDWVPPHKIGDYLATAWIGLAPYQPTQCFNQITIGNSRKIMEYMAFGLPVVGPSFGEVARVVAEENAGILVDTSNPEALAAGILQILENNYLRDRMSANGISAIKQKYNWEKESVKLIKSYRILENSLCNHFDQSIERQIKINV